MSDLHTKLVRFETAWDVNEVYDALTRLESLESKLAIAREALEKIVKDEEGDYDLLVIHAKSALSRMEVRETA